MGVKRDFYSLLARTLYNKFSDSSYTTKEANMAIRASENINQLDELYRQAYCGNHSGWRFYDFNDRLARHLKHCVRPQYEHVMRITSWRVR